MTLTFLIGGARSGKSSLAVEIGRRFDGPVTFVATAPITDDDMERRIERHRNERPSSWTTIEEEVDLAGALASVNDGLIIIDCLTLWTSNMMWNEVPDDEIGSRAVTLAITCAAGSAHVVAISNEVGSGVHPDTELGRRYRDVLGHVNQAFAATADPALLLVAGRAVPLVDPWQIISR